MSGNGAKNPRTTLMRAADISITISGTDASRTFERISVASARGNILDNGRTGPLDRCGREIPETGKPKVRDDYRQ